MKTLKRSITTVALMVLSAFIFSTAAQAETGYRYWSYWLFQDGQWTMAPAGAGTTPAVEGQLQGWRFITSGVDAPTDLAPRTDETFEQICVAVEKQSGIERVALVIDYGTIYDYDAGTEVKPVESVCATVESGDPSSILLAKSATVRELNGFVCAINQLPAKGCGESVEYDPAQPVTDATAFEMVGEVMTEEESPDVFATVVTTGLGLVVFVMAFRRMQWQKEQKRKALEDKKAKDL